MSDGLRTMNAVQTLLIEAIHAGALELTKHNADSVLVLYVSLDDFIRRLPNPLDSLKDDLKAVEKWVFFAMRAGSESYAASTDDELRARVLGTEPAEA
jgi:hypothetical protein